MKNFLWYCIFLTLSVYAVGGQWVQTSPAPWLSTPIVRAHDQMLVSMTCIYLINYVMHSSNSLAS